MSRLLHRPAPGHTPATSPAMGRPRQFVPAEALRDALAVFWEKGYQATSLDDLTAAMHLSRSSFYACFGSKHAVMMAAVELYANELFARLVALAASSSPAVESIHAVMAAIAEVDAGPHGCFFVNSVTELAPHDAALAAFSQHHVARTGALVIGLLERAGLSPETAHTRAAALLALVLGTITLRKAGLPVAELQAILSQAQLLLADATSAA